MLEDYDSVSCHSFHIHSLIISGKKSRTGNVKSRYEIRNNFRNAFFETKREINNSLIGALNFNFISTYVFLYRKIYVMRDCGNNIKGVCIAEGIFFTITTHY